jgi:protein-L-isoaspartate(D-aspartate) O-methyltransferase
MKKEDMLLSIKVNNPGLEQEVVEAFEVCDRAFFVKNNIYYDMPQHIAYGQTISQPSTIARMLRLSRLEKGLSVLEIGANTGYHAALAAYIIQPGRVMTIEIFPELAKNAMKNLRAMKKKVKKTKKLNIKVIAGDALDKKTEVWKYKYDRIYFTAGVTGEKVHQVHLMAKKLLKEKGLLLYPTREIADWGALELWQLRNKKLKRILRERGYAFVPLIKKDEL